MRFGMYVPNFGTFGSVQTLADLARAAEAAGWDGFFLWDHILPDADSALGPVVDPWIALTAIASATSRLKFGALVTPFARRRPWKLARETVSLDNYSSGRLIIGAGIGGDWWREYSAVGEKRDDRGRADMLDEGLDVLTGLWTGKPFSYRGTYYTVENAHFLPPPLPDAANSDLGRRCLARHAPVSSRGPLGWHLSDWTVRHTHAGRYAADARVYCPSSHGDHTV